MKNQFNFILNLQFEIGRTGMTCQKIGSLAEGSG